MTNRRPQLGLQLSGDGRQEGKTIVGMLNIDPNPVKRKWTEVQEFIGKVATLKWGKAMSFPYVQNACLMTNLVSPKVSDGICKLLQPSAVSALTSKDNLVKVQEAEQLMQDARKLCDTMAASTPARTRAIGMLDTRCILHILKKHKDANDVAFESINAIGEVTD